MSSSNGEQPPGHPESEDTLTALPGGERSLPPPGGTAVSPSGFSRDQVVSGRFRIVRFIGQGGMGEVYEAEDLDLRERVALKTIRPDIAASEPVIERFKREIHLARKVTHPNVCRIYDLFRHGDTLFLSMELLEGQTLAERVRRAGRLAPEEALPIIDQMAAGLDAAHTAGVVHRDFKTGNVILTPPKGETGAVRAVVTDFGLARGGEGSDNFASQFAAKGTILGTPAYMAPEQFEGGEVTKASDIYALGIVMYEMLTGMQPLLGDSPISTGVKRLREAPPSPRTHVPDLDLKWESAILRCLETDPLNRFASAGEVRRALAGETMAAPAWPAARWLLLAVLVILAAAAAVGTYLLRVSQPPPMRSRRSVAVLGFKNLSGRPAAAWLSTALAEMLTTELAAGENLRTIPGENVAQMKIDLALGEADSFSRETLARIRTNLGSDLVVFGAYTALGEESGGKIRLDLRLQDARAGETVAAVAESGTEANLLELVSQAGARLREKLGVGRVTAAEAGAVRAALPADPEGARLYSEGVAKLRLFDALEARALLQRAVAAEPQNPLAHSALAAAWAALGYDARARDEAKKAFDLSSGLSREDRLWVEARYRETNREHQRAIEIYRALRSFFPDNLEYGLRLAAAETAAGKAKDALATVDELRRLGAGDPRIELAEALAAGALSDFKREQRAAVAAAVRAEAQQARILVARARSSEGRALIYLGEPEKARAAWEDAKRIYDAAGDRFNVAQIESQLGAVYYNQGDFDGAKKLYEESLAVARQIGSTRAVASALNNIASVVYMQGRLAEARKMYEESLAAYREVGNQGGVSTALNNIGEVLHQQGDLAGGRKLYEESLAIKNEIGDKRGATHTMNKMAALLQQQGNLAGSRKLYEQCLALNASIGSKSVAAQVAFGLGEVLVAEGSLPAAREKHAEALALRNELGEKGHAAESRLALATLAIEEGRAGEAEAPARESTELFRSQKSVDNEAAGRTVVARALLAQGKSDQAQAEMDRAMAVAAKTANPLVRVPAAITEARIRAALGRPAEAVKALKSALATARKNGLVLLELETRLALAEIGKNRSELQGVEKEAGAKGFGLIAQKAAAAGR